MAKKLNEHKNSAVLKYGHCFITVVDDDTITIDRYIDGQDALGRKAARGAQSITIKR